MTRIVVTEAQKLILENQDFIMTVLHFLTPNRGVTEGIVQQRLAIKEFLDRAEVI